MPVQKGLKVIEVEFTCIARSKVSEVSFTLCRVFGQIFNLCTHA